jgi:hypothetical protein
MTAIDEFDLSILLDHLNKLRLGAVRETPPDELEWILGDFVRSWGQRLLLDPETWLPVTQRTDQRSCGITYLPFSTASDFPAVCPNHVRILALATACLPLYMSLLDAIIDAPATTPTAAKAAIQPLLIRFYRLLSQLFPVDSSFWGEANRVLELSLQTMVDEYETHTGQVRPFPVDEFRRIAHGKMAFMQVNCIGMAMLNGTPEHIPALTECWDAIGLAAIARDDIYDWQEDYSQASYTYLLSQVLFSPPFRREVEAGQLPQLEEVGAALFCTDLCESLYELACTDLRAAAERASEINCPALAGLIRLFHTKMREQLAEMFELRMATMLSARTSSLQSVTE